MPFWKPDPIWPVLQANAARRRNRGWVSPGPVYVPTTFLTDSMTGTNGTALESHTGEVGATWTKHTGWTGNFTIQANRIVPDGSTEAHYYASGVPPNADYDVTTTIFIGSNATFALAGPMGRMVVGTNSGYAAQGFFSGSAAFVILRRWVAGTGTDLASGPSITTPTVGSTHTLTLRMAGSSITSLWDGAVIQTVTDTNIAAAGRAGVITNGVGSSSTGWHIDDVSAIG